MDSMMDSESFRDWRRSMGWKQKDAADRLGLKKRVIQYYEKGDRDGKRVEIPRTVELACLALAIGVRHYDGHPVPKNASELVGRPSDPSTIEALD